MRSHFALWIAVALVVAFVLAPASVAEQCPRSLLLCAASHVRCRNRFDSDCCLWPATSTCWFYYAKAGEQHTQHLGQNHIGGDDNQLEYPSYLPERND